MTDKERTLLKKLKALANQGIGGEKINAEKKLKDLMNKLGITSDELDLESEHIYTIHLKKRKYTSYHFEFKLLCQILSSVLEPSEYDELRGQLNGKKAEIVLKPSVAIELQAKYEFYSKALYDDLDIFYTSFIYANNLCSKKVQSRGELSEEELEKVIKAEMMQENFRHEYFKQIEYKR